MRRTEWSYEAQYSETRSSGTVPSGMCTFSGKKVTSSHKKGETVILTEQPVEEQAVRDALADTGYDVTAVASHPYQKKGLFGFRKG